MCNDEGCQLNRNTSINDPNKGKLNFWKDKNFNQKDTPIIYIIVHIFRLFTSPKDKEVSTWQDSVFTYREST